jgi:hypothetical protein
MLVQTKYRLMRKNEPNDVKVSSLKTLCWWASPLLATYLAIKLIGGLLRYDMQGAQAGVRAGMNVVWVPDESLRALDPNETHGAHVTIEHLAEFRPEQWGLPAFEDSNRLQGTVDA